MITKEQVDAAIAAAKDALDTDGDFSWVRKSAMIQRAYYIGLYAGLRAIAHEDDLIRLLIDMLVGTMFPLSKDDSFDSTPLGREFNKLKKSLVDRENAAALPEATAALTTELQELDRRWDSASAHAKRLCESLLCLVDKHPAAPGDEQPIWRERYPLIEELEHVTRLLSLIQMDHYKWKSLQK